MGYILWMPKVLEISVATLIIHATQMSLYKIVSLIHMIYDFLGLHSLPPFIFQQERSSVGIISISLIKSRGRKSIVNAIVTIVVADCSKLIDTDFNHISICR